MKGNNVFDNPQGLTLARGNRPATVVDVATWEARRPVLDLEINANARAQEAKPGRSVELPPALQPLAPYLDITKNMGGLLQELNRRGVTNQNGDQVQLPPRAWDTEILALFYPYLKSDKRTLDFPYNFYFDDTDGAGLTGSSSVYNAFVQYMFASFASGSPTRWNAWNMANTADKARIAGMDLYAMRVIPAFSVYNKTQNVDLSNWVEKVLYPWFMSVFAFRIFNDASTSDPVINVTAFANCWNRFDDGFTRVPDVHFDANDNNGRLEVGSLGNATAGNLKFPAGASDTVVISGSLLLEGRWVDTRPAAEGILDWIRRNPQ